MPATLAKRPEIDDPALIDLASAFWALSSTRQIGYGAVGGIQWAEIAAYLRFNPQADELRFCEIMRRLDHEYLDQRRSQAEQRSKDK